MDIFSCSCYEIRRVPLCMYIATARPARFHKTFILKFASGNIVASVVGSVLFFRMTVTVRVTGRFNVASDGNDSFNKYAKGSVTIV